MLLRRYQLVAILLFGLLLQSRVIAENTLRQPGLTRIEGRVKFGGQYEASVGEDLRLVLSPNFDGWRVALVRRVLNTDKHCEICLPLHGGSECDILIECVTRQGSCPPYLASKVRKIPIRMISETDDKGSEKATAGDTTFKQCMAVLTVRELRVKARNTGNAISDAEMEFSVEMSSCADLVD